MQENILPTSCIPMYQSMEEEITFYGPNSTYRTTMDFSEIVEK